MKETALRIRVYGEQVLRKKAKLVKQVTAVHREILSQMSGLMYDAGGVGLAAPQVGISESMIVIDIGKGIYKLVNPKIVKKEGAQSMEEGCLSIPGVSIKVKRAKKVIVNALDENGRHVEIEAEELLACVFQHEIEHLNGKLIVDYASWLDKVKIRQKLKTIRKQIANAEVCESKPKSCKL